MDEKLFFRQRNTTLGEFWSFMKYKCYIINLDRAPDRWEATSKKFLEQGFDVVRVPAIDGKELQLPHPDFIAWQYFLLRGRPVIPQIIGCSLSHIKALETFLDTDDEFALICEDDVTPMPGTSEIIEEAMAYSDQWDLLRLNGIKPTRGIDFASLSGGYHLCCDLKTASGNGAKIVNRHAARRIIEKTLPIRFPHDVALFYDFPIGIREVSVQPFPIQLNDVLYKKSCIGMEPKAKEFRYFFPRLFVTFPYRTCARTVRKISRIYWALKQKAIAKKRNRTK